ncbi:hypothetical protein Asulf_01325 [Archaeoglobus sulfaticallidus PM70-1]|uniref:Uncharacterized protein n=1 Tax=Archaeoglobus sulfaticallidus PM70-1 TaxID=387631 RepID=N0BL96_9EURY|nr:hypothetical protein [Archaeoglobus sulfaticallidus]AGK61316.1 hypothetical protein Asulf_01325 [Archaeoglobus sulfaticallidus PM70-1]
MSLPWVLKLIQLLAAFIFILMIAPSVKRLPFRIWFGKSIVLFIYLLFICVAILHEGGHMFAYTIFGVKFTYHFDLLSLLHVTAESPPPPTVQLISLAMGPIFQAVLGYIFLFSDWDFLKKFREGFLDKNLTNITLFLIIVLLGSFLDIYGIIVISWDLLN